jgi:GTPase SAR1 family protein
MANGDRQTDQIGLAPEAKIEVPEVSVPEVSSAFAALVSPPNQSLASPAAPALSVSAEPKSRDRIVILGRRRAGKTIFLARLYEQLWKSDSHFHMRAVSGETHKACMTVIDELRNNRWPASTLGAQYSDIEITFNNGKHLLVALDYPGEVFRKAFVDNADTEDAKELLDHVDRAAAVILLLDPAVMQSQCIDESIDDEFGMVQAIHRIREWPGGAEIPIVMVFTKCDVRKELLRNSGGLKAYAAKEYMNLVRAMGRFKVFACAAVNAAADTNGKVIPSINSKPIGVIEPLEYCLKKIVEREEADRHRAAAKERMLAFQKQTLDEYNSRRRAILFWSIFWSVAAVVIATIGFVTWILTNGSESP